MGGNAFLTTEDSNSPFPHPARPYLHSFQIRRKSFYLYFFRVRKVYCGRARFLGRVSSSSEDSSYLAFRGGCSRPCGR